MWDLIPLNLKIWLFTILYLNVKVMFKVTGFLFLHSYNYYMSWHSPVQCLSTPSSLVRGDLYYLRYLVMFMDTKGSPKKTDGRTYRFLLSSCDSKIPLLMAMTICHNRSSKDWRARLASDQNPSTNWCESLNNNQHRSYAGTVIFSSCRRMHYFICLCLVLW